MSPPANNSARAPAANADKGDRPPDSGSAKALLVALAEGVVVALVLALELAVAEADAGGQTPSGSNAVWSLVPNSTFPLGLK